VLSTIRNVLKVPDLRNKVLFTIAMLAIYRLGSYVPVPGIDQNAVNAIKEQAREGGVLVPAALQRKGAHAVRALRARHHALHHELDHHADPDGGDPQAAAVAGTGCCRAAQDHAVDPVPNHRHLGPAVDRPGLLVPQRWRRSLKQRQHRPRSELRWIPGCSSFSRSPREQRCSCGWARRSPNAASATACRSSSSRLGGVLPARNWQLRRRRAGLASCSPCCS
jgi:hypothetical protein